MMLLAGATPARHPSSEQHRTSVSTSDGHEKGEIENTYISPTEENNSRKTLSGTLGSAPITSTVRSTKESAMITDQNRLSYLYSPQQQLARVQAVVLERSGLSSRVANKGARS